MLKLPCAIVFWCISATCCFASSTLSLDTLLMRIDELRLEQHYDEAIELCSLSREAMSEAFTHRYDASLTTVRLEYMAQEAQLEADHAKFGLYLRIGISCVLLSVAGVVAYRFIRRRNRAVARSEAKMQAAVQQAMLAEKSKSMLLSNMTHEIRTPLNAIAGFSDLYTLPDIDDDVRHEAATIIEMNSHLLQNLIDDVVRADATDLSEMKFHIVPCDVAKLCRNVTEMLAKIKQTDAEIRHECTVEHLTIMVDPLRLQQVLVNVLVNATKFCKVGSIVLRLDDDPVARVATISVTDTGIGIPIDKQAGVFKRFERVRENAEGFGLGLSICQFIIERFGGRIWVDPKYTDGARFVFTLPYNNRCEI